MIQKSSVFLDVKNNFHVSRSAVHVRRLVAWCWLRLPSALPTGT